MNENRWIITIWKLIKDDKEKGKYDTIFFPIEGNYEAVKKYEKELVEIYGLTKEEELDMDIMTVDEWFMSYAKKSK